MPDIDVLDTVTTIADGDSIPLYDADETDPVKLKRITYANFKTGFPGLGSMTTEDISSATTLTSLNKAVFCDGTFTVTMPAGTEGEWIFVKNVGAGTITVASTTSITGTATVAAGKSRMFIRGTSVYYGLVEWT